MKTPTPLRSELEVKLADAPGPRVPATDAYGDDVRLAIERAGGSGAGNDDLQRLLDEHLQRAEHLIKMLGSADPGPVQFQRRREAMHSLNAARAIEDALAH